MDAEKIAFNIKKMLEYRLNSSEIKFNVVFGKYKRMKSKQKLKYKIETDANNQFLVTYMFDDSSEFHRYAYINADFNYVKANIQDVRQIVLYPSDLEKKISNLAANYEKTCELFEMKVFLENYRDKIYYVPCCKSDETTDEKIQYISHDDYNVKYLGLLPNDNIFSINIAHTTNINPKIMQVKKIN